MSRKPPAVPAADTTVKATPDLLQQTRTEAGACRERATAARAEADVTVTTARAQAQRLVADAERHARELLASAVKAERTADALDAHAGELAHIDSLREQIAQTEQHLVQLATDGDAITGQITALDGRLAELGEQRESAGMRLATAREAGDVDRVGAQRARLAAIDEVVGTLTSQQQAARSRLDAVGTPDGTGTLGAAVQRLQGLRAALRAALNKQDPDRPEALFDQLADGLLGYVAAALEPEPVKRHVVRVQGR